MKWGSTGALKVRTGAFKSKVKLKYETEKYIYTKNINLDTFRNKWAI